MNVKCNQEEKKGKKREQERSLKRRRTKDRASLQREREKSFYSSASFSFSSSLPCFSLDRLSARLAKVGSILFQSKLRTQKQDLTSFPFVKKKYDV